MRKARRLDHLVEEQVVVHPATPNWFGKTPNYRAQVDNDYEAPTGAKVGSFITYNASVSTTSRSRPRFSILANNLLNKMPPKDHTLGGTTGEPYDNWNFNPYGRALYLEARYNFGGK